MMPSKESARGEPSTVRRRMDLLFSTFLAHLDRQKMLEMLKVVESRIAVRRSSKYEGLEREVARAITDGFRDS